MVRAGLSTAEGKNSAARRTVPRPRIFDVALCGLASREHPIAALAAIYAAVKLRACEPGNELRQDDGSVTTFTSAQPMW